MATEVKITEDSFIKKKEVAPAIWGWWEDSKARMPTAKPENLLYSQDPHGRRRAMTPRCSLSDLNNVLCADAHMCTSVYVPTHNKQMLKLLLKS